MELSDLEVGREVWVAPFGGPPERRYVVSSGPRWAWLTSADGFDTYRRPLADLYPTREAAEAGCRRRGGEGS